MELKSVHLGGLAKDFDKAENLPFSRCSRYFFDVHSFGILYLKMNLKSTEVIRVFKKERKKLPRAKINDKRRFRMIPVLELKVPVNKQKALISMHEAPKCS